jgi:hypothetical protein
VAVASPARFDEDIRRHRQARRAGFLLVGNGRMPMEAGAKAAAAVGAHGAMARELANPDNMDPATTRGLAKVAIVDLPRALGRQAVLWLREGELVTAEGEPWLANAGDAAVPLLVMAGDADQIAGAENCAAACEIFSDCRFESLTVEGGYASDYGHIDPVLGATAAGEIYPLISDFLSAHRG